MQSVFIIQILYLQIHLLYKIYNPLINTCGVFMSFADIHKTVKNLSLPMHTFPPEVEQSDALPSRFSSHVISKCAFCGLFSATLCTLLCFLFVILCLKWSPSVVLNCCLVFLSVRRL